MSSEKDTNQTTVNDLEFWLKFMFEHEGFNFSDRKIKTSDQEVWGLEVIEEKQVFAFFIINDTDPEEIFLEMRSVLGKVPKGNLLPFYRKCLELNHGFSRGSITLNEAEVWFFQYQDIETFSPEAFVQMFISHISDTKELYETLSDEFEIQEIVDPRSIK